MLLERAGIAYTGSPPARAGAGAAQAQGEGGAARARGVPTPDGASTWRRPTCPAVTLPFPLIVKPSREDASTGISSRVGRARSRRARAPGGRTSSRATASPRWSSATSKGREIYVSMLGRRDGGIDLLPLHEIDFSEMPAGPAAHRLVRRRSGTRTRPNTAARSRCRCARPAGRGRGAHRDRGAEPRSRRWSCATTAAWTFASRPTARPTSST